MSLSSSAQSPELLNARTSPRIPNRYSLPIYPKIPPVLFLPFFICPSSLLRVPLPFPPTALGPSPLFPLHLPLYPLRLLPALSNFPPATEKRPQIAALILTSNSHPFDRAIRRSDPFAHPLKIVSALRDHIFLKQRSVRGSYLIHPPSQTLNLFK